MNSNRRRGIIKRCQDITGMQSTEVPDILLTEVVSYLTLRGLWIIGFGILAIWLVKKKRISWKRTMSAFGKSGKSAVLDVFWYDRENSATTEKLYNKVESKMKSQNYNVIKVAGTHDIKEGKCINEASDIPIIAVCRRSTCRFESTIDACLQGLEEKDYVRTLVIFLHPEGSEQLLRISTEQKVELSKNYLGLKIIDIIFYKILFLPYYAIKSCHGRDYWKDVKEFLGHWNGKKESA